MVAHLKAFAVGGAFGAPLGIIIAEIIVRLVS
jgi:hypothetical protein